MTGPLYALERWLPGDHTTAWTTLATTGDRDTAIRLMAGTAAADPHAYGPHGYSRLRVREVTR